jgi:hypothetical protein
LLCLAKKKFNCMLRSAFELGEELKLREVTYKLHSTLWNRFNLSDLNLNFETWQKLKYLNNEADDLNPLIEDIPNNLGGIYVFYIKCEIITGLTEYPLYIGRAQLTEGQNLRKRVKEYYQKYAREDERPKITRMFNYWANELQLAYYTLGGNQEIVDLEKKLINSLLLPMNDEIPDEETRQGVKAF